MESTYAPVYSDMSAMQAPYGPKEPATFGSFTPDSDSTENKL